MSTIHKYCAKSFTCDKCRYDFCEKCAPDCESDFCIPEFQCPNCVKIYQLVCDNVADPFDEIYEEDYSEEEPDEKNVCEECLSVLVYCQTCDVICNADSKKHANLSHTIIDLSNDKNIAQFKKDHQLLQIKCHDDDSNWNRGEVIEIICADIKNIGKNLIKYKNFFPNIISLGDILHQIVSNNKVADAKFFMDKYSKKHDITKMINEPVHGYYSGEITSPSIVNAQSKEMIDLLLAHGGNINAYSIIARNGKIYETCLISYIDKNNGNYYKNVDAVIDFLDYLYSKGADVNLGSPLDKLANYSILDKRPDRQKIMFWLYDHGARSTKLIKKYPDFMTWYNNYKLSTNSK